MTPEEFAELGHQLVDDIADLMGSMRTRPLTSGESPTEVRALLDAGAPLPGEGTPSRDLLAEVTSVLINHSLYNGHPRFFGYITAGPSPLGILGDLLASAVNPNVGAWVLSPVASEIEAQTVRWLGELVGYPSGGDGILVSGGNVANMLGFWAARAAKAPWDVRASGARGGGARGLTVYGAEGTHTWIQKATDLSGLGTDAIRWVETESDGRISLDSLRRRIEEDRSSGLVPFFVIGNAGSVATGIVDPFPALRTICDEYDLWLHADGAYGAFAACVSGAPEDLRAIALA